MKRVLYKSILVFSIIPLLFACGVDQTEFNKLKIERDSLAAKVNECNAVIQALRDSVTMLAFPADQRLSKINSLVSSGDYTSAKQEIARLTSLFLSRKRQRPLRLLLRRLTA